MKKMIAEFLMGVVFTVIGFFAFAGIYNVLKSLKLDIFFGGDKAIVFFGLFLGMPIGSILGIFLIDKLIYKLQGFNAVGCSFGIILGIASGFLGIIMLDKLGGISIFLIPFIITFFCYMGYKFGFLF